MFPIIDLSITPTVNSDSLKIPTPTVVESTPASLEETSSTPPVTPAPVSHVPGILHAKHSQHKHGRRNGAFELFRIVGPGFGAGQMLIQYDKRNRSRMNILEMFIPETTQVTERMQAPESKIVYFDRKKLPENHVVDVVEVSVSPADGAQFKISYLCGKPMGDWRKFTPTALPIAVTKVQQAKLEMFTGIAVKTFEEIQAERKLRNAANAKRNGRRRAPGVPLGKDFGLTGAPSQKVHQELNAMFNNIPVK